MNRKLAIGYFLIVVVFSADLALLRWFATPAENTLLIGQAIHAVLLPAAILLFSGSRHSTGRIRKVLGYSLSALAAFGGISAMVAIGLIVSGHANLVAA